MATADQQESDCSPLEKKIIRQVEVMCTRMRMLYDEYFINVEYVTLVSEVTASVRVCLCVVCIDYPVLPRATWNIHVWHEIEWQSVSP